MSPNKDETIIKEQLPLDNVDTDISFFYEDEKVQTFDIFSRSSK